MRSLNSVSRLRPLLDRIDARLTPAPVPAHLRNRLTLQQAARLRAYMPLLCLVIAANALAMTVAVLGDLPWWQQLAPPILIVGTCLVGLAKAMRTRTTADVSDARRMLRSTTISAVLLGLLTGVWGVNAFEETEQFYCMVAPAFIGIAALVAATCLLSAPRAAIGGMIATVSPIVIKMAAFDNLGVRAMAAMMVLVTVMQACIVLARFRETIGIMVMEDELNQLARTDALTGRDNRHAFFDKLDDQLRKRAPFTLVLTDLDGFKQVNDRFGHLAGDAVLKEVSDRLNRLAHHAHSVARLGGDEFALLFKADATGRSPAHPSLEALRASIELPIVHAGQVVCVGASFGVAAFPLDGDDETALIEAADMRLYANKLAQRPPRAPARSASAATG